MNSSREGMQIKARFFQALDELKASKSIRGIATFTKLYGIDRRNLIKVKNDNENSFVKPEWLCYLSRDFNISSNWLILGIGPMYRVKPLTGTERLRKWRLYRAKQKEQDAGTQTDMEPKTDK